MGAGQFPPGGEWMCCGWPSAETPEIGHFLGQSRLCFLLDLQARAAPVNQRSTRGGSSSTKAPGYLGELYPVSRFAGLLRQRRCRISCARDRPTASTPRTTASGDETARQQRAGLPVGGAGGRRAHARRGRRRARGTTAVLSGGYAGDAAVG